MNSNDIPDEATIPATDEFFTRQPALPDGSEADGDPIIPGPPLPESGSSGTEDELTHPSVVDDYVRELQQEYEEQQEEGKI